MSKLIFETLKVSELSLGVWEVRFSRPQVSNAMNTQMARELAEVFSGGILEKNARCVVLTGEGNRAFCAGADLKERNGMNLKQWKTQHQVFEAAASAVSNFPFPLVAAINGAAFGGGLELMLCCDFAYSKPDAKFAFSEVKLGIMPGLGGIYRLREAVGLPRAKQLVLTGEVFTAEDASSWGLLNGVFPEESLVDDVVERIAKPISANAPLALRAIKRSFSHSSGLGLEQWTSFEHREYYSLVGSEDRIEGIEAFNEKRKANFIGK